MPQKEWSYNKHTVMIVGFLADENNKTPLNLGLLVKLLSKNGLVIHGPITKEIPVSETN